VLHKTSNSYVILLFEGQQRPRPLGKSGVEKRAGTGRRGQKAGRERDERKDRSRSNKEEKGERGEEIGGETQERHRRERRWLLRVQAQACPIQPWRMGKTHTARYKVAQIMSMLMQLHIKPQTQSKVPQFWRQI